MSQQFPVNGFQWVENTSPFKDSDAGYFLDIFLNIFA